MKTRTYRLPWPISVNAYLTPSRKRGQMLSPQARKWFDAANEELGLQRPDRIKGPVSLCIRLTPPTKRAYDPDNKTKVSIDALVKFGIIEDDKNAIVRWIVVEADAKEVIPGAYVTVIPIDNPASRTIGNIAPDTDEQEAA